MKPPICDVCDRRFDPDKEGGLVYFKDTKAGRDFERRASEEGITGHPPDAGWFSRLHYQDAARLSHLTIGRVSYILRRRFEKY